MTVVVAFGQLGFIIRKKSKVGWQTRAASYLVSLGRRSNELPKRKFIVHPRYMSPVQIMEHLFSGNDQWQPEISHVSDLPPIVRDWHIYLSDSGHCLLTLVEGTFEYTAPGEQWKHLVAIPIDRVLSGYRIYAGYLVIDKSLYC